MLRVGIIGLGFMGRMHYRCWTALEDVQVVALCDANRNIIEDSKQAGGNIEGASDAFDFDAVSLYHDVDEMLQKEDLDAISIALPTHLHMQTTVKALEAGCHVLCEKPMALNVDECNTMIAAAKETGKTLQIGQCIRFWPEYAYAKEVVESGRYGSCQAARFTRLSSPPGWSAEGWLLDTARSGGMVIDLHIHDTDFVHYLFGMPQVVRSFGVRDQGGGFGHVVTHYGYEDDKVVSAEGGWLMMASFGFEMSFHIALEKATLVYDCTQSPAFRVCPADGEAFTPDLRAGDGYSAEIEHFAKVIQGEDLAPVASLEQCRDSVKIVNAEIESADKKSAISLK